MLSQLNTEDKLRAKNALVLLVYKQNPMLRKHIAKLIKLIRSHKSPKAALHNLIINYIGREMTYYVLEFIVLRQRKIYDMQENKNVCHGCLSYCAQTTMQMLPLAGRRHAAVR